MAQDREHIQQTAEPDGANDAQSQQAQGTQDTDTSQSLEQQLESEKRKAAEYLDLLQRIQADFINYKRRMTQEQAEVQVNAHVTMLQQLLPVLDDLGRALTVTPPDLANNPWVQGILLVSRRLIAALEQLGVRQIGKPGEPFDPRWHEAMTMEPRADVPEGTIVNVTRPGYALGDRIIRPAQVIVASATSPAGEI